MSNLETVNQGAADWCIVHGNVWSHRPQHTLPLSRTGVQIQHACMGHVMISSYILQKWHRQFFIWPSLLMVSWIVRDFTQLSIEFYRLHACQLSTVPGRGGGGGGWVTIWLVCPGYCADQAYTNPDNTGMQPHNQHARHRRMEWIPRAHISNQNISVFGSHTYSYFLYCCRSTTARDLASSLSLARRVSLVL